MFIILAVQWLILTKKKREQNAWNLYLLRKRKETATETEEKIDAKKNVAYHCRIQLNQKRIHLYAISSIIRFWLQFNRNFCYRFCCIITSKRSHNEIFFYRLCSVCSILINVCVSFLRFVTSQSVRYWYISKWSWFLLLFFAIVVGGCLPIQYEIVEHSSTLVLLSDAHILLGMFYDEILWVHGVL